MDYVGKQRFRIAFARDFTLTPFSPVINSKKYAPCPEMLFYIYFCQMYCYLPNVYLDKISLLINE